MAELLSTEQAKAEDDNNLASFVEGLLEEGWILHSAEDVQEKYKELTGRIVKLH